MKLRKANAGVAIAAAGALLLAACSGSDQGSDGDENVLTVWHYENPDSAMGVAWDRAMDIFEEETGAKVEIEERSFEQIRTSASQILNSDEAPDVLEYPKGNATAALLARQRQLSPLDDSVDQYGGDDLLPPPLQITAGDDVHGMMGSGSWFGVATDGVFVEVYYDA